MPWPAASTLRIVLLGHLSVTAGRIEMLGWLRRSAAFGTCGEPSALQGARRVRGSRAPILRTAV
jgi:hypothetical protein